MEWIGFVKTRIDVRIIDGSQLGQSLTDTSSDRFEATFGVGAALVQVLELLVGFEMHSKLKFSVVIPGEFHVKEGKCFVYHH